jgi:hypothetical protein
MPKTSRISGGCAAGESGEKDAMKLDVPDDYIPLLITALEHYYAYTKAVQREDPRYQQAADWFHQSPKPLSAKQVRTVKRKRYAPHLSPPKTRAHRGKPARSRP